MSYFRNGRRYLEGRQGLGRQIERDIKLLNVLREELAVRIAEQELRASKFQADISFLDQAGSQLQVAKSQQNYLEKTLKAILETISRHVTTSNRQILSTLQFPSSFDNTTRRNDEFIRYIEKSLDEAKRDIHDMQEAIYNTEKYLQRTRGLQRVNGDVVNGITIQINSLEKLIARNKGRLNPIWDIPKQVWAQIFMGVIGHGISGADSGMKRVLLLTLREVCPHWKYLIMSHPALRVTATTWSTIEKITFSPGDVQYIPLLASIHHHLSNIHTLDVNGAAVDRMAPLLLDIKHPQRPQPSTQLLMFPSLRKLIISNYQGDGGIICEVAKQRQSWLSSVTTEGDCRQRPSAVRGCCSSYEEAYTTVEWFFRRSNLALPDRQPTSYRVMYLRRRDREHPTVLS